MRETLTSLSLNIAASWMSLLIYLRSIRSNLHTLRGSMVLFLLLYLGFTNHLTDFLPCFISLSFQGNANV